MNKEVADSIKEELLDDHNYEDAYELLGEEETVRSLRLLDTVTAVLETDISSWCLDHIHDLIDLEEETLCRVFWFSKGMSDTYIAIDNNLQLKAYEEGIERNLLCDVLTALDEISG